MTPWKPKSFEDKLLHEYWTKIGGLLFVEVAIANNKRNSFWPEGSKVRRIDGIRIINSKKNEIINFKHNGSMFIDSIAGKPVELIEVKRKLNRLVIGQIIAGHEIFIMDYQSGPINRIILCSEGDPALEWVCKLRNIEVKLIQLNDTKV